MEINYCNFIKKNVGESCVFEGHRWFDLRRYGMPELTHIYFVKTGEKEILTLQEEDPRYVLPIPPSALEYNPYLVQNER